MTKRWTLTVFFWALTVCAMAQGTVSSVTIRGNKNVSTEAITAAMKTQPGSPLTQKQLLDDETSVRNMGFFKDVKILSRAVTDTESEVVVEVAEFPIMVEVRVIGNTVLGTEQLTKIVTDRQQMGLVWNNRNGKPIRDEIIKLYESKGYRGVQIDSLGPDQVSEGTLTLSLVEPIVDKITLLGLKRTKERVIKRIMRTKPGHPLNYSDWQRDIEELYYTYWFTEDGVKPASEPSDKPGHYNLTIEFKESQTGLLNAGVALDPQSRLVGTLSYSDSNFLGHGQSVGVQLSQATAGGGPSVDLGFSDRFYDSKDTSLNVQVFSRVVYNFTGTGVDPFGGSGTSGKFDERRTGASVNFARPYGRYRASLGFRGSNIKTLNLNPTPIDEYIQQDGNLYSLVLGAAYDTRRPSAEPYRGELMQLTIEPGFSDVSAIGGAVKNFTDVLGKNSFIKSGLEYRRFWSKSAAENTPLDKPRPVVAFRAKYNNISGTVPFFEQNFIGGADSLRGYANQRFWGRQSALATLEYRHPIQRSLNLIGFADYGAAWGGYGQLKDFVQSSSPQFKLGYGVGVGFRIPRLGLIRIDFAFNQEGQNRTHFTFGSSF